MPAPDLITPSNAPLAVVYGNKLAREPADSEKVELEAKRQRVLFDDDEDQLSFKVRQLSEIINSCTELMQKIDQEKMRRLRMQRAELQGLYRPPRDDFDPTDYGDGDHETASSD